MVKNNITIDENKIEENIVDVEDNNTFHISYGKRNGIEEYYDIWIEESPVIIYMSPSKMEELFKEMKGFLKERGKIMTEEKEEESICPFGLKDRLSCVGKECAIYDSPNKSCSIRSTARFTDWIYKRMREK